MVIHYSRRYEFLQLDASQIEDIKDMGKLWRKVDHVVTVYSSISVTVLPSRGQ